MEQVAGRKILMRELQGHDPLTGKSRDDGEIFVPLRLGNLKPVVVVFFLIVCGSCVHDLFPL